jgi:hypothetical protein
MAETANRLVDNTDGANGTSPSTAEMKAAIRQTRSRLTTRLSETAEHIHLVLTVPSAAEKEPAVGGVLGGAINTLAVVGRTTRAWHDAKRTGVLSRGAVVAASVAIAGAVASKARRS